MEHQTLKAWSMRRLAHRPSNPVYYIDDWLSLHVVHYTRTYIHWLCLYCWSYQMLLSLSIGDDGQQQQKEYLERNSKLNFFGLLHSNVVPFVKCQDKLTRQKLVESQLKIGINEWKKKLFHHWPQSKVFKVYCMY